MNVCQMVIRPVRGTYITTYRYFLLKNEKIAAFKLASRAIFAIAC